MVLDLYMEALRGGPSPDYHARQVLTALNLCDLLEEDSLTERQIASFSRQLRKIQNELVEAGYLAAKAEQADLPEALNRALDTLKGSVTRLF